MDIRAPWWQRLARSPWMRLAAGLAAVLLPVLVVQLLLWFAHLPPAVAMPIAAIAGTLAALFGYRAYVLWIEQRRVTELAMAPLGREWLAGCALGAGLMVVTVGVLALAGSYHVDGRVAGAGALRVMAMPLLASIGAGVIEELALRGLVFRLVEEALGTWWSLAISALLFGALHLGNPHATLASAAAISLEAGILLAAAYLVTRRLWLPMGIHAAWNFVQGGVFGIPVSGGDPQGWLRSHLTGPAWLSGGGFGAEASVVAFAACLCAGLVLLRHAYVAGRFMPGRGRRARFAGEGASAAGVVPSMAMVTTVATSLAFAASVALLAAPGAARAANTVADSGFAVHLEATIHAPPARVYQAVVDEVAHWWNGAHTFSHDAANLSIDARPGGCFCERRPGGGGVEHLRVVNVAPGSLLRMAGALGPMQGSGIAGVLTLKFDPLDGGTQVQLVYSAGGYLEGGFAGIAPMAEGMLGEQLARLKSYVETGKPEGKAGEAPDGKH